MYKNITTNLMVEDVDSTVDFYSKILGFAVTVSVPKKDGKLQFAIVNKDNLALMFQERKNLIEEYPILKTAKTQPSATLYITVDNFDAIYKELKSKQVILCDLHKTFYGADEFAIKDNNGYVLTFTKYNENP